MKLNKAIRNRRTFYPKQFNGNTVPLEVVSEMLELANWAPTHKRTRPWRFMVYSKKAKDNTLDLFKELYVKHTPSEKFNPHKVEKLEERKKQVSHIIAIVCDYNPALLPEFEETASTAMAVQNMWLYLASTKKYGGYWSTPNYSLAEEFSSYLKLDENQKCLGVFYVGEIDKDCRDQNGQREDWKEKVIFYK